MNTLKAFFISISLSTYNIETSWGFITPKMSITPVNDYKTLVTMESDSKSVVLVSGNGCRACMRFKPHFVSLSHKFDEVNMYEVSLNGYDHDTGLKSSLLQYAQKNGVNVIPTVIVKGKTSTTGITGSRNNIDDISKLIEDII